MTGVLNLHFKLLNGEFFTAIRKDFILRTGVQALNPTCHQATTPRPLSLSEYTRSTIDRDIPGRRRHFDFRHSISLVIALQVSTSEAVDQSGGRSPEVHFHMPQESG